MVLSPKTLFQKQETSNSAFVTMAASEHFQIALSAALAEFAHSQKPSTEEMNGVRKFLDVLLNISKPIEGRRTPPLKSLNHEVVRPDYTGLKPEPKKD